MPDDEAPSPLLRLALALDYSRKIDEAGKQLGGDHDDDGRLAAATALKGVIEYLDAVGLGIEKRNPLYRLVFALQDLDTGFVGDMLRPPKVSHRAPDSIERQAAKGWAAAAMDVLMQPGSDGSKGMPKQAAARRVAREVGSWPIADRPDFSWRTVANWRDKANAGSEHEDFDAAVYQAFRARLRDRDIPRDQAFAALVRGRPWG
jgi:hypothetical protein